LKENWQLTPQKEELWRFWFDLYQRHRLAEGEYLGFLYDLAFDVPEAHVIRKEDTFYYAFFADSFEGEIELRGLKSRRRYRLLDYENNRPLGEVSGPTARLNVHFTHHLLIQASPDS